MSIFKFVTTKPTAISIWTILSNIAIAPREGYSTSNIKYRMFIHLQLHSSFKKAVRDCNTIIDDDKASLHDILTYTRVLALCQEKDFLNLEVKSDKFPNFISSDLYEPYHLTKMLCLRLSNYSFMSTLFDRTSMLNDELTLMRLDSKVDSIKDLTIYRLYNYSNIDLEVLQWINIAYSKIPTIIDKNLTETEAKNTILYYIKNTLETYILKSGTNMISKDNKLTIPYFKLGTNNDT